MGHSKIRHLLLKLALIFGAHYSPYHFLRQLRKGFSLNVLHFSKKESHQKGMQVLDQDVSTPLSRHISSLSHINDAVEEFQEAESLYSTNTMLFVPEGCCVPRIPSAICTHVPGGDVNTWVSQTSGGAVKAARFQHLLWGTVKPVHHLSD